MALIKLSAGNDQYWLLNDVPHQRGQFDISARIGQDVVEIYSLNTLKSLTRGKYDEYSPDGVTPYASTQALIDDLKTFFFRSVSGGGGGAVNSVTASSPLSSTGGTDPVISATKVVTAGLSSGIIEGGELSINVDNTKFDIADGNGVIIDNTTTPNTPIVYEVTWTGLTAQTVTNIATSTVSFIFIDNTGAIVQTTEPPTEENTRDYIYVGQLGHANLSTIATAVPQPNLFASPVHLFRDIFQTLGYVNIGNVITANGANLSIDKSIGSLVGEGAGFYDNAKAPSRKDLPAQVLATIRRRTQTGGSGTSTTIDVSNYDLNGTVTAISGTKAQNQRVYLLTSGNIVIQYGQQLYNSISEATQGLSGESFVELDNVKQGQLIAIITVQSNCTSLQDTSRARIANLGRFGTLASATSGVSVTSLQQAYNNSVNPEIITDTTRNGVTIRRGSAADTDDVLQVQNGAGSTTFSVDGNGNITANNFTPITLLQGVSAALNGGGDLSGNTKYTQDITVTGAVVGDKVDVGLSDLLSNDLTTANIRPTYYAWVVSANTVRVAISISSFLSGNAGYTMWCRIVK